MTSIRLGDLEKRGIIKAESEPKNEIKIAGTSIANLLMQHDERLADLEHSSLHSRVAALEKRLQDLQERVDGQVFDRIRMLEESVGHSPEYGVCKHGENDYNLESRVAALERTLKPTE